MSPDYQQCDVEVSPVLTMKGFGRLACQWWLWSETKNIPVLVLVLQVWCCVVKHGLVTLVVIIDLEGHSNFSRTIHSFSVLCLEHHYCGDQQWRSLT